MRLLVRYEIHFNIRYVSISIDDDANERANGYFNSSN